MKKLLLLLLIAAGFFTLTPNAEAGHRDRYSRHDRYDHCDRPSYGYSHRSYYRSRPVYYAPVRSYYRTSYRDYDDCGPRYYRSRPRVSIAFGF